MFILCFMEVKRNSSLTTQEAVLQLKIYFKIAYQSYICTWEIERKI